VKRGGGGGGGVAPPLPRPLTGEKGPGAKRREKEPSPPAALVFEPPRTRADEMTFFVCGKKRGGASKGVGQEGGGKKNGSFSFLRAARRRGGSWRY